MLCDYVRLSDTGKILSINSKWVQKCIISMMLRRKTFKTIGYFVDACISEDSDYYERIKAVFGKHSIAYISRILYRARFSPNSRLFGNGTIKIHNNKIEYDKSATEAKMDSKLRDRHTAIAKGEKKVYICKKKALSKIRNSNWQLTTRDQKHPG